MVKVTIEFLPGGSEYNKSHLGTILISNDGTGDINTGNYYATASTKDKKSWKNARVKDFPRRKLLAYDLLYRVLDKMVGGRNR
jgi:hypothetical protein